jgi:hypothetical protein
MYELIGIYADRWGALVVGVTIITWLLWLAGRAGDDDPRR